MQGATYPCLAAATAGVGTCARVAQSNGSRPSATHCSAERTTVPAFLGMCMNRKGDEMLGGQGMTGKGASPGLGNGTPPEPA